MFVPSSGVGNASISTSQNSTNVQDASSAVPTCDLCMNPVVSPTTGVSCSQACRASHFACFGCLLWWYREVLVKNTAEGEPVIYKCPFCKTPSTDVDANCLNIHDTLTGKHPHSQALLPAGDNGVVMADESQANPTGASNSEFDIYYIAGIHVTGANGEVQYKVVWCPRDVTRGEEASQWVQLSYVVQLGAKVRDFQTRWGIPPVELLSVGFKWEHELPVASRGKWRCPHDGCDYITDLMSNCRKHIGSVHSPNKPRCTLCGSSFATVANLNKHVKKYHMATQ